VAIPLLSFLLYDVYQVRLPFPIIFTLFPLYIHTQNILRYIQATAVQVAEIWWRKYVHKNIPFL
jgi:hypothetical protein